jgi:hypothetical protein
MKWKVGSLTKMISVVPNQTNGKYTQITNIRNIKEYTTINLIVLNDNRW